jgi:hypothetical protein
MAAVGKEIVLFGGHDGVGWLDDTWIWNGTAWTKAAPPEGPSGRLFHAMAVVGPRLVLFGGWGSEGPLGDTWMWNGSTWTDSLSTFGPPARANHALTAAGDEMVLFGGTNDLSSGTSMADTWRSFVHERPRTASDAQSTGGAAGK